MDETIAYEPQPDQDTDVSPTAPLTEPTVGEADATSPDISMDTEPAPTVSPDGEGGSPDPADDVPLAPLAADAEPRCAAADMPTMEASFRAEAEALRERYPGFDPEAAWVDPRIGGVMRGEGRLTLRQIYEAVSFDRLMEERIAAHAAAGEASVDARVAEAVERAVGAAVDAAVQASEERLLDHLRLNGARPAENGTSGESGIRMQFAVDRLTRKERAMLADRAQNGEFVHL